jgi:hypothetical protein
VNKVKSHRIIEKLIQKSSIEAFIEDVVEVEKRLDNGLISNLRQLELELVCSAKVRDNLAHRRGYSLTEVAGITVGYRILQVSGSRLGTGRFASCR